MSNAFSISIPHLRTERLTLREYRREDFDAFADHFANHYANHPANPDTAADPSAAGLSEADRHMAWRIFCSHAGLWLVGGAGWWAVEETHTGQLVGSVGAFFREQSTMLELGWNTYRAVRGRGYAIEAAAAALRHAFEMRREPKVQALIAPGNASSLRVAQRLGLTYEEETVLAGEAIGSYTLRREDWIA